MGQKILVVEDNELNLKLFCDLLRAHGYEAEPVRDGREAVDRARAFAPELIIMDIQMPYVSGLELIEQLKADEELKRTPIMAVTAYAAKGDEERIRAAGAEGYVSKQISLMRFIEAVRALLVPAEEESGDGNGAPNRHSGESRNPDEAPTTAAGHARQAPDPRLRGDGEEGPEAETAPASPAEGEDAAAVEEAQAPDRPEDDAPEGAGIT